MNNQSAFKDAAARDAVLRAVYAHAKQRWCWDDITFLEEQVDRLYKPDDTPADFVDALARDYDLEDPRATPWW